jgi:para-aminobenzoate synthetase component 1
VTVNPLHELWCHIPERIVRVESRAISLTEPFIDFVRRYAHFPGTVALMSGGSSDCARYHMLGIHPWLTLHGNISEVTFVTPKRTHRATLDPFAAMDEIVRRFSTLPPDAGSPVSSGLFGYLSYDLKDCIEELPRTSVDDLRLPHCHLSIPSILIVQDCRTGATTMHVPTFEVEIPEIQQWVAEFEHTLTCPPTLRGASELRTGTFSSGFDRATYMSAIDSIKDYIVRGHVYQVNMSQRFQAAFEGDPFEMYASLYQRNPAAFFAYINAGDHQIVSTSPERFIQLDGRAVETRPIKGTRPRGRTRDEDETYRRDLETCPKDDAELSMIVDLLRNDIGKVCKANSVRVTEHKRIEAYENVYHLVSIVKGELDDDKNAVDLIRATFPGGSITGCPKIRSMEVIDELEPVRRHIYTGSIGYVGFSGTLDLSIAIRTATITNGNVYFSVGGGVVYDSNPSDEYDETLHKGRTIMRLLEANQAKQHPCFVWHDGALKPTSEAHVSVEDEGFQYGSGLFETLRVDAGAPRMLHEHVERLNRSWSACFRSPPPDVTWRDIVQQVIVANGLESATAVVKILATAGKPGRPNGTLLVTAREYVHRLARLNRPGLDLVVFPHRRMTYLADHKTQNYLFYKLAGNWATEQGAHEALILNEDGSVSETNTANLFCLSGGTVLCPDSAHALPGITEAAVIRLLRSWNISVERRKLTLDELKRSDYLFLTNSLMGAVPVCQLDGHPLPLENDLCSRINIALFGRDLGSSATQHRPSEPRMAVASAQQFSSAT